MTGDAFADVGVPLPAVGSGAFDRWQPTISVTATTATGIAREDGISEAMNAADQEWGEDRLMDAI